jgi:hypothetical protein
LDVNGIRAAEQEGRSRPNRDSRPSFAQGKLRGDLGALLGQQDNHHTASKPRAMAPQGDVSSLLAATACAATNPWQPTAGCGLQGAQRVAGPRWKDADGGWGGQPGRSMSKSSKGISKVRNSSFLRERPLPKAKSHPPTAKTSNALMGLRRPARPGMRILKRFLQQALGLA